MYCINRSFPLIHFHPYISQAHPVTISFVTDGTVPPYNTERIGPIYVNILGHNLRTKNFSPHAADFCKKNDGEETFDGLCRFKLIDVGTESEVSEIMVPNTMVTVPVQISYPKIVQRLIKREDANEQPRFDLINDEKLITVPVQMIPTIIDGKKLSSIRIFNRNGSLSVGYRSAYS